LADPFSYYVELIVIRRILRNFGDKVASLCATLPVENISHHYLHDGRTITVL